MAMSMEVVGRDTLNYQVFYLYQIQNRYHKQRVPSLSLISRVTAIQSDLNLITRNS
jgi:hypothetical protein